MRRLLTTFLLVAAGLLSETPNTATAQTQIGARAANVTIGGRVHGQYATSSIAAADNDFFIRRARINVDIAFNEFFVGRITPDFAKGKATLQDAYMRLNIDPRFRVSGGQFKRSFDLFELDSSTDLSIIERTGAVDGFDSCPGVGSVCSYSRLTEALDFAGRDVGVKVDGSSGNLSYEATVTNGTGIGVPDENDGKSVSGRVALDVTPDVTIGGQVAVHDYVNPIDETKGAFAWGGDVQYGTWRDGLMIQAAVAGGDNWQSLDAFDQPAQFVAFQAVASYYVPLAGDRIVGIEPIGRLSVADADDSMSSDGGTLFTPGIMFYLMGKNKVGFNFDFYTPEGGDAEYSLKFQSFLYF